MAYYKIVLWVKVKIIFCKIADKNIWFYINTWEAQEVGSGKIILKSPHFIGKNKCKSQWAID